MQQTTGDRSMLIESILEHGRKAFNPAIEEGERQPTISGFNSVISNARTWPLVRALNYLIKPDAAPVWLRPQLIYLLTILPLRSDGVRCTLEFIFAVHPTSGSGSGEERPSGSASSIKKRGANITPEALAMATQLLSSPPRTVSAETWVKGLAPQLFVMLDGEQGEELIKVASHIICSGFLSKKQLGAPGAPAWIAFVDPIQHAINPSLRNKASVDAAREADGVVDLTTHRVLTVPEDLVISLRRLMCLILSSSHPSQCRRILSPILLPLWTLASWPNPSRLAEDNICIPSRSLVHTFLQINTQQEKLMLLTHNILANGTTTGNQDSGAWSYQLTPDGKVQAVNTWRIPSDHDIGILSHKSDALVDVLASACTKEDLSSLFLALFRRWLAADEERRPTQAGIQVMAAQAAAGDNSDGLFEIAVLQRLIEKTPEKLISQFNQLLDLICEVLESDASRQQPEEVVSVTLSLLNIVITAPNFQRQQLRPEVLSALETSLGRLGRMDREQISPTAKNLAMLLQYRDELEGTQTSVSVPNERQFEDRKTYSLAMSYIADKESPPPVRSEGLNLISGLLQSKSSVLDVPSVLVLLSSLIKDEEDFVTLRVIKVYTQVASRHPKSVLNDLIDRYVDSKELLATDARLRFGEALLQVIERLGETFAGDMARHTTEALLSIAGRRGCRPKTQRKQEREEQARARKTKAAEDAWEGEVPDISEDIAEGERLRNEVLAQIVEGWSSKRGNEDVRVRASALSILATAMDTNLAGIAPSIASSAVDLGINVLTLEPEMEKAILRRAAIIAVLSFVRGLDQARRDGRKLGFTLLDSSREDILRTLRYVSTCDNDGLVQRHAKDVVESLENWQLSRMLPVEGSQPPLLNKLAGLTVGLPNPSAPRSGSRPLIEEVEDQ